MFQGERGHLSFSHQCKQYKYGFPEHFSRPLSETEIKHATDNQKHMRSQLQSQQEGTQNIKALAALHE